jgi:hypothetical protein
VKFGGRQRLSPNFTSIEIEIKKGRDFSSVYPIVVLSFKEINLNQVIDRHKRKPRTVVVRGNLLLLLPFCHVTVLINRPKQMTFSQVRDLISDIYQTSLLKVERVCML